MASLCLHSNAHPRHQNRETCVARQRGRHLDVRLVEEAAHAVVGVVAGGAPRVQQRAHAAGARHEVQQRLPLALRIAPAACGSGNWALLPKHFKSNLGYLIKDDYRPQLNFACGQRQLWQGLAYRCGCARRRSWRASPPRRAAPGRGGPCSAWRCRAPGPAHQPYTLIPGIEAQQPPWRAAPARRGHVLHDAAVLKDLHNNKFPIPSFETSRRLSAFVAMYRARRNGSCRTRTAQGRGVNLEHRQQLVGTSEVRHFTWVTLSLQSGTSPAWAGQ